MGFFQLKHHDLRSKRSIAFGLNDQRAFTVVEMMISMALIAILAALSFFAVQAIMPGYRLNGAIRMVRGDLYNAKMLAAKKNRQYKVVFSANGYQLQKGTSNVGAFSLDQVELSRTFSDYPRVTVKTSATADPVFSPRGTASNGTITLQNSGGDEKTITTSIAGRIKING
jgi:prepilin-type N-terminal cleavage/methylation domain-containing protein